MAPVNDGVRCESVKRRVKGCFFKLTFGLCKSALYLLKNLYFKRCFNKCKGFLGKLQKKWFALFANSMSLLQEHGSGTGGTEN